MMPVQAGSEAAAPAAPAALAESYSSKPSQFATKLGDKKKAAARQNAKKGGGAGKAGGAKTAPDQGARSSTLQRSRPLGLLGGSHGL
jgi:hypothetical protein